jgi:hypothetical protein
MKLPTHLHVELVYTLLFFTMPCSYATNINFTPSQLLRRNRRADAAISPAQWCDGLFACYDYCTWCAPIPNWIDRVLPNLRENVIVKNV